MLPSEPRISARESEFLPAFPFPSRSRVATLICIASLGRPSHNNKNQHNAIVVKPVCLDTTHWSCPIRQITNKPMNKRTPYITQEINNSINNRSTAGNQHHKGPIGILWFKHTAKIKILTTKPSQDPCNSVKLIKRDSKNSPRWSKVRRLEGSPRPFYIFLSDQDAANIATPSTCIHTNRMSKSSVGVAPFL